MALIAGLSLGLLGGLGGTSSAETGGAVAARPTEAADPAQWRVRKAIVAAAKSQVGKREKGTTNLYPKEYQVNKDVVRPAEWCGVFVYWAWSKGGASKLPPMKPKKNAPGIDQGHWATYWQKWGKAVNRWKPISKRNVTIGDAVVYGNYPARIAHVGLVVDVKYDRNGKATHVKTVEGNISQMVSDYGNKWRKLSDLSARGQKATGFVSPV